MLHSRVLAQKGDLGGAWKVLSNLLEEYSSLKQAGLQWTFGLELVSILEAAALLMRNAKDYERAAEIQQRVLDTYRSRSGDESEETLRAKQNLGLTLSEIGDPQKLLLAEELLTNVCGATNRVYGPLHRFSIVSKSNLGSVKVKIDKVEDGVRLKSEAFEEAVAGLGEDHPDTLTIRRDLAALYLGKKRDIEAARRTLVDLLASERRRADPDAVVTQSLLDGLDELNPPAVS